MSLHILSVGNSMSICTETYVSTVYARYVYIYIHNGNVFVAEYLPREKIGQSEKIEPRARNRNR